MTVPSAQQNLSNWQINAQNRSYHPCDRCKADRRRCEGGVPCARCRDRDRACTVEGFTREQYYNALVQENGSRRPHIIARQEGDGYLVLMNHNGSVWLQHVTLHYVKLGPPNFITSQSTLDWINNNEGVILAEMLNNLYNNSPQ